MSKDIREGMLSFFKLIKNKLCPTTAPDLNLPTAESPGVNNMDKQLGRKKNVENASTVPIWSQQDVSDVSDESNPPTYLSLGSTVRLSGSQENIK